MNCPTHLSVSDELPTLSSLASTLPSSSLFLPFPIHDLGLFPPKLMSTLPHASSRKCVLSQVMIWLFCGSTVSWAEITQSRPLGLVVWWLSTGSRLGGGSRAAERKGTWLEELR